MLSELRVRELGVIEDLALVLGPGMTAVTGETGAGKTLVVEAIELLVGGRAEGLRVRQGAAEALVEGRFVGGGPGEVVLSRVVPVDGRSRAYVNGQMATASALAELGSGLVDLHGQHSHQSLLSAPAQRDALDTFGGTDPRRRAAAQARARQLEEALAAAGGGVAGGGGTAGGGAGGAGGREREAELLAHQLAELEAANLAGAGEDEVLAAEEERLSRAASHREAAYRAYEALAGEEQVLDRLGAVVKALANHPPLEALQARLRALEAELADAASEVREAAESLLDDPARLAEVTSRRALLHQLRRKYAGPGGSLADVIAYQDQARQRLAELEGWAARAAELERALAEARADLRQAATELGHARRAAAASLGPAVEAVLQALAMPRARFEVRVGGADGGPVGPAEMAALAGDEVAFFLAANPGEVPLPLSKVASGGELARAMLALRLVLSGLSGAVLSGEAGPCVPSVGSEEPRTLVFDEVDAGIGGEAALAVGRALAALGQRHQVIVVTHLAQVAAFADAQVAVSKVERAGRSVAVARPLDGQERVVELSRMLSGQPGSLTARRHAEELLATARRAH